MCSSFEFNPTKEFHCGYRPKCRAQVSASNQSKWIFITGRPSAKPVRKRTNGCCSMRWAAMPLFLPVATKSRKPGLSSILSRRRGTQKKVRLICSFILLDRGGQKKRIICSRATAARGGDYERESFSGECTRLACWF